MTKQQMNAILEKVARENGVTPQHVYRSMQESIDEARQNPDPLVQARWRNIPHKGESVTVEEFLDYMYSTIML